MSSSAPSTLSPTATVAIPTDLQMREALEATRAEIAAVRPGDLVTINLVISDAAITVIGCARKLQPYRERIVRELPTMDPTIIDRLERYALAAYQAHFQYTTAFRQAQPIQELADQLSEVRAVLLSDAQALARRGMVDGSRLKELSGTIGYRNVVNDVGILTTIFRDHWSKLDGNTAVKLPELERAEQLAKRQMAQLGLREQDPAEATEVTELRQRAFSLFVNTYSQVRRAITFLRWDEGDSETIAPSLYGGRNRKKREEEPVLPVTPSASGNGPAPVPIPAPTQPGSPPNGPAIPPGMPGNAPFTNR